MGRHQLERLSSQEWRCTSCTWTWTRPPVSSCPGVPRYGWWPAVPEHLKTQTQLKQAGLKPTGEVKGCVAGQTMWYLGRRPAEGTVLQPGHEALNVANAQPLIVICSSVATR